MISLHLSNEEKTYLNRSEVNKLSYPLMDRAWINAKKKSSVSALDEGNRQKIFIAKREIYMNIQHAEALGMDIFSEVCSHRPAVKDKNLPSGTSWLTV